MFGFGEKAPPKKPAYGFYSKIAAELYGTFVYKTPAGKEVEVTAVFNVKDNGLRAYRWGDKTCVGEVTELVRFGKVPVRFDKEGQDRNGRKVKMAA